MARGAALPITIRQVTKTYGRVHALDHVDLDIRSGEFLTLLGPSGSGKTTLLMVLAGFTRPDHGSLRFGEEEMIRRPPHKRDVGMVFQNYALFPHMDVAANVAFPLRLRGVAKAEAARRVEAALDLVQLGGYGGRRVDQLSGGQRQRVALARAIVFEPRILLMDEPLSALDKQLRERMQIELRRLHERLGMTTVYVTHDQREALTMSDRIAVIHGGGIMQLDTPRHIYEQPASRFVAEFIGESSFLPVSRSAAGFVHAGRLLRTTSAPAAAERHLLMVRPERLRLLAGNDGAGDDGAGDDRPGDSGVGDDNRFAATVEDVVYQGDSVLVQAVLADGTRIAVRTAPGAAAVPATGSAVTLGLAPADTVVIADR